MDISEQVIKEAIYKKKRKVWGEVGDQLLISETVWDANCAKEAASYYLDATYFVLSVHCTVEVYCTWRNPSFTAYPWADSSLQNDQGQWQSLPLLVAQNAKCSESRCGMLFMVLKKARRRTASSTKSFFSVTAQWSRWMVTEVSTVHAEKKTILITFTEVNTFLHL